MGSSLAAERLVTQDVAEHCLGFLCICILLLVSPCLRALAPLFMQVLFIFACVVFLVLVFLLPLCSSLFPLLVLYISSLAQLAHVFSSLALVY